MQQIHHPPRPIPRPSRLPPMRHHHATCPQGQSRSLGLRTQHPGPQFPQFPQSLHSPTSYPSTTSSSTTNFNYPTPSGQHLYDHPTPATSSTSPMPSTSSVPNAHHRQDPRCHVPSNHWPYLPCLHERPPQLSNTSHVPLRALSCRTVWDN